MPNAIKHPRKKDRFFFGGAATAGATAGNGVAWVPASAAPQFEQKRWPASFRVPQVEQKIALDCGLVGVTLDMECFSFLCTGGVFGS